MKRPSRTAYSKCIKKKISNEISLDDIKNIKTLQSKNQHECITNVPICNVIIDNIIRIKDTNISKLRENLYNILIYNLNIYDSIWYIVKELCEKNYIKKNKLTEVMLETYKFFLHFNNNYRPIYHLENYIIYIINIIHEHGKGL